MIETSPRPRLTRSESDRILAGVCGGIAEFLSIDATIVRIVFVLLAVFGGSGIVLYLAAWAIVPRADRVDAPPRDAVRDALDEGGELARTGLREGRKLAERAGERVRRAVDRRHD
jgi:phage shock protein C